MKGAVSSETLEPVYQPTCCHNLEVKGAVSSETLEPVYQPTCCHNLEVKGAVSSETLEPVYQPTLLGFPRFHGGTRGFWRGRVRDKMADSSL